MKWLIGLLATLACATPPASAQQFVNQRVVGAVRHCTYTNPSVTARRRAPLVERRIGRGEPCPRRFARSEMTSPDPSRSVEPSIPTMATLTSQDVREGQRICIYSYIGRTYRRAIPLTSVCTYTPLLPH